MSSSKETHDVVWRGDGKKTILMGIDRRPCIETEQRLASAENGENKANQDRGLHTPVLFCKKSTGIGLRIFLVHEKQFIRDEFLGLCVLNIVDPWDWRGHAFGRRPCFPFPKSHVLVSSNSAVPLNRFLLSS